MRDPTQPQPNGDKPRAPTFLPQTLSGDGGLWGAESEQQCLVGGCSKEQGWLLSVAPQGQRAPPLPGGGSQECEALLPPQFWQPLT